MAKTTANSTPITSETVDGVTYYTTIRAGVEYYTYFQETVGEWWVGSRRLALGRGAGSGKYVKDIGDHPAFAALPAMIKAGMM